jgi:predicted flap endonuclease-1-like 5' DNA nuclease
MAQDMQDQVRELAYSMWEAAGRQQGMAMEYWIAAERQIRATFQAAADAMTPSAKKPPAAKAPAPEAKATKPATPAPAETAKPAAKAPAKAAKPAVKPPVKAAKPADKPPAKATQPAAKAPAKPAAPKKEPAKKAGYGVEEIEGIGPAYAAKLASAGIETTNHLLDMCGSAASRTAVADKTGISAKLLLKWANMADLMRISGVGGEFAELLEAAGVDTIKELKTRNADNLAAKMTEINTVKKLTRRVASVKQVTKWVEQAKALDPKISH